MEIDRFKHHHVQILQGIKKMREYAHAGIAEHASVIAQQLKELSSLVTLHLAIEDRILYPALRQGADAELARMGKAYQDDMKGIASAYIAFSRQWRTGAAIAAAAEEFRAQANVVLRDLHARMQRENREFYPAIEAA
ncbi:hemerythrin domain-containing protein [Pusillimonas sp. TS35]|nr:hemerythrin domain-containing protein [Pusillimonas sp. TS35]